MKCLLILALAAAASASADPYMFYSGYHSPLSYSSAFYSPYGYHAVSPGVSHSVFKREAEPFYYSGLPYTYGHHAAYTPAVYGHGVYGIKANGGTFSNDAVSPWGYAAKGRYVASSAGATHIAKREAEPYYYGAGYMPSVYSHGVYAPSVYSHGVYAPSAYAGPLAFPGMKTYSNDAVKPFNYAAKGRYHADSLGAKHVAKREAEPYFYAAGYATPHVSSFNPYTRTSVHVPTTPYKPYSYIKYFH